MNIFDRLKLWIAVWQFKKILKKSSIPANLLRASKAVQPIREKLGNVVNRCYTEEEIQANKDRVRIGRAANLWSKSNFMRFLDTNSKSSARENTKH